MPDPALWLTLLAALGWLAAAGLLVLLLGLAFGLGRAPRLGQAPAAEPPPAEGQPLGGAGLTVIVPTYNEAANIDTCLDALLASELPGRPWQVVVADDGSLDGTPELVQARLNAGSLPAGRLTLLACGPRPAGERWCGKTWPCSEAVRRLAPTPDADRAETAWLLFLDADVTVEPRALAAALAEAEREAVDLLSLAPRLSCGCLAEWLVQPIVAVLLGLGFPLARTNDPADPTAFAAGPFMLFRRSAYERIGGHRAVAGEVVEDLALARAIKGRGLRLRYLLALDLVSLRMYRSFAALWEGWTKNWHLGLQGNVPLTLASGAAVLLLYTVPWLLLPAAPALGPRGLPLLAAALAGVALQLVIRLWCRRHVQLPLRHWWLAGLGGLVIAAIAPVSIWKTRTGRGWTWRGRSLAEG